MTANSRKDTEAAPVTYTRTETMNDVYTVRPIEAAISLDGFGRCTLSVELATLQLHVTDTAPGTITVEQRGAVFVIRAGGDQSAYHSPPYIVSMNATAQDWLRQACKQAEANFRPIRATSEPCRTVAEIRRARMH